MAIITFTSDFGLKDAYVAIVKAKILSINPALSILDISHHIAPADIAEGAFLLGTTYTEFANGTVHLAAINSVGSKGDKYIALEFNNHFFVGTNNGMLSLFMDPIPTNIVELTFSSVSNFPAKDILAEAAAKLATGTPLSELGRTFVDFKRMIGRNVRASKKEIAGTVISVDYHGNLITNIKKTDYENFSKEKNYTIVFGRHNSSKLNKQSNEVDPGDWFVYFNHLGLLEIGIRNGNASQLLGLKLDSSVWIKFDDL